MFITIFDELFAKSFIMFFGTFNLQQDKLSRIYVRKHMFQPKHSSQIAMPLKHLTLGSCLDVIKHDNVFGIHNTVS